MIRRNNLLELCIAIVSTAVVVVSASTNDNKQPAFMSSDLLANKKTVFQTPTEFKQLLRNGKLRSTSRNNKNNNNNNKKNRRLEDEEDRDEEEDNENEDEQQEGEQEEEQEEEEEEEEEEDGNDERDQYSLQYGKCLRVKIPENYDDDQAEGVQNYYNGKYYSLYMRYVSFYMCDGDNGGNSCFSESSCDYEIEYVVDMETYLETAVEFTQGYCNSCANQCRRRKLEDEEEDGGENGDYDVNCNSCKEQCQLMFNGGGDVDEANYLECQEAFVDDDGNQLYSAPACDGDGYLHIGTFYDDECYIKANAEYNLGFQYNTFRTIEGMCLDCAASADEECEEFFDDAIYCKDGYQVDGAEDDYKVCKAYKSARKEWKYSSGKKSYHIIPLVILAILLCGCCFTYSYGYYIRHRDYKESDDTTGAADGDKESSTDYVKHDEKTDNLPNVS